MTDRRLRHSKAEAFRQAASGVGLRTAGPIVKAGIEFCCAMNPIAQSAGDLFLRPRLPRRGSIHPEPQPATRAVSADRLASARSSSAEWSYRNFTTPGRAQILRPITSQKILLALAPICPFARRLGHEPFPLKVKLRPGVAKAMPGLATSSTGRARAETFARSHKAAPTPRPFSAPPIPNGVK